MSATFKKTGLILSKGEAYREFVKALSQHSYRQGVSSLKMLVSVLKALCDGFDAHDYKACVKDEVHADILKKYFAALTEGLESRDWCDLFGDLYMEFSSSLNKSRNGQFFTPENVCDLMAAITLYPIDPDSPDVQTLSDPCCGSGRILLAADAAFRREGARRPFLVASDIDSECCLMTAVNFLVHGCMGEVVCMDSLRGPDTFTHGYIVNETGLLPSVRKSKDPRDFSVFRAA